MCKEQVCTECLMDTSDPSISFDMKGVCNYCNSFKHTSQLMGKIPDGIKVWKETIEPTILKSKKGKYDCVIGISGGIDSSYLAYLIKNKTVLSPLLVHVKNDIWDSDVSKRNLKRILDYTGFDIEYPSVKMNEYISLQRAYFYASVIDTDVPADYLIEAFIRKIAIKHKLQYILSGGNYFADAFMPYSWTYPNKLDRINMLNIYRLYGDGTPLTSFPVFGAYEYLKGRYIHKLKYTTPLNYFDYNRFEAIAELEKELGYEMYADKHGENIFTRFYQNYILPVKFGVDKRKANYSNYIRAGGITREQGLAMLSKPLYDPRMFASDKKIVLSTLRFSEEEFDKIMNLAVMPHELFGSDKWVYNTETSIRHILKIIRDLLLKRKLPK
jgi:N-acetyl sugar amidotransferase